jgi:hypothetical protein
VKSVFQLHSDGSDATDGVVSNQAAYWARVTSVLSIQKPAGS